MRKIVNTSNSGSYRNYKCPHCEGLIVQNSNSITDNNEIERINISNTVACITFNFNCKKCKKALQTSIDYNSNNQPLN